ncbi:MAG: alkaline shock response membrane anchor protein AmaP [Actinomycetota bacterium]|nr:alkaline shock response membrane anchor protein AmaP [Actinomycetota bacterium]
MDLVWPATLACGTRPELLLASVTDGDESVAAAHVDSCPSCRDALRQLRPRLDVLRRTGTVPPAAPARIQRQVLARIRHLRAGDLVEIDDRGGRTAVSEDVIASYSRAAAEQVDGVHGAQVTLRPPGLFLDVRLTVGFERPIPEVVAAVRSAIDTMMEAQLAIITAGIDVDITDIDAPSARRSAGRGL